MRVSFTSGIHNCMYVIGMNCNNILQTALGSFCILYIRLYRCICVALYSCLQTKCWITQFCHTMYIYKYNFRSLCNNDKCLGTQHLVDAMYFFLNNELHLKFTIRYVNFNILTNGQKDPPTLPFDQTEFYRSNLFVQ